MASGSPIYKWVPVDLENVRTLDGYLPQGAVLAGWEGGKPTYVARAHHNGHWELGKLNHWATIGYASFGVELEVHEGEVLVAVEDQVMLQELFTYQLMDSGRTCSCRKDVCLIVHSTEQFPVLL